MAMTSMGIFRQLRGQVLDQGSGCGANLGKAAPAAGRRGKIPNWLGARTKISDLHRVVVCRGDEGGGRHGGDVLSLNSLVLRRARERRVHLVTPVARALVAFASILCISIPLAASPVAGATSRTTLTFDDVRGDGNALNSQGEKGIEISQPTPVGVDAGDIVKVTVTSDPQLGRSGGVRVKIKLATPPEPGISYQFEAEAALGRFYIAHLETANGEVRDMFFCGEIEGEPIVKVRNRTIVLTAKAEGLAEAVDLEALEYPWAETRVATGSAGLYLTFPAIDSAAP